MRRTLLFLVFSALTCEIFAQVLPKEGGQLNYRLIGFSCPVSDGATMSKIEIAKGTYDTDASFKKHIVKTISTKKTKVIEEVPGWGENYTWRYTYISKASKSVASALYHFSTLIIPQIGPNSMRLRVVKSSSKYAGAFVLLDSNKIMYDMKGNPVWFLPDNLRNQGAVSDIKLSTSGTITLIAEGQAYEINYNGDILWEAPNNWKVSNVKDECYHHQFTRLSNGHYLLLRNEFAPWRPSQAALANGVSMGQTNERSHRNILFGSIVEYDKSGNKIWSWNSSNYFLESDVNYGYPYNNQSDIHSRDITDTHANAFYFDEEDSNIYVGYKNISRILKVKYPGGNVTNVYGKAYMAGKPTGPDVFCGQHSISKSKNRNLYVFDNHICDEAGGSRLLLLKEPSGTDADLKILWEYPLVFDSPKINRNEKGGDIMEMRDGSLFVCMGMYYSKLLIMDKDKKISWLAIPELWSDNEKKWKGNSQYRASIIEGHDELEKLIWNTEASANASVEVGNSIQSSTK